jgi:hypothetical protein
VGCLRDRRFQVGTGQRPNPWKEDDDCDDDDDDDDVVDKIKVKFNLEQAMIPRGGVEV